MEKCRNAKTYLMVVSVPHHFQLANHCILDWKKCMSSKLVTEPERKMVMISSNSLCTTKKRPVVYLISIFSQEILDTMVIANKKEHVNDVWPYKEFAGWN
jgi:hypothetical protein